MQEPSHHGKTVQEYRELRLGLSQEELAQRIGKSRRTIVAIEQSAYINSPKLRRTLAWALQIPSELLDISNPPSVDIAIFYPLEDIPAPHSASLKPEIFETFTENLRMRFDVYYHAGALAADRNLNAHIERLKQMLPETSSMNRDGLLTLLSHNYQLKGLIARDLLDFEVAKRCFREASLWAQQAGCVELHTLTMARLAVVCIMQKQLDSANNLYDMAREISKRSPAALRAYLAVGHAEVQGKLKDQSCLASLTKAHTLLAGIDPKDDPLLLFHSTRCSIQSINDGWAQCHTFIGKPMLAIEYYDDLEGKLDLSMTRMRARIYTQYAEALDVSKELSCCFYAIEGLKLARSVGSQYNIRRIKQLALKLGSLYPHDGGVKDLLQELHMTVEDIQKEFRD